MLPAAMRGRAVQVPGRVPSASALTAAAPSGPALSTYPASLIGNLPPSRTLRIRGVDGTRRPRLHPACSTMRDRIDLLPAIAGIAIAAGRVNPALLVACAFVAIVTGAGLGREVFAVLGWDRLMKVAGPLHARVPLGRASAMLQRNGWRAVFTARLIPGLRVHTTDVAGVSQMPRRTFMGGLLPATAVYVAAFVGLDAAFGRPILRVIHEAEHQLLVLIACVAVGALPVVWSRALARRALASAGGWTGVLTFRLDSPGIIRTARQAAHGAGSLLDLSELAHATGGWAHPRARRGEAFAFGFRSRRSLAKIAVAAGSPAWSALC